MQVSLKTIQEDWGEERLLEESFLFCCSNSRMLLRSHVIFSRDSLLGWRTRLDYCSVLTSLDTRDHSDNVSGSSTIPKSITIMTSLREYSLYFVICFIATCVGGESIKMSTVKPSLGMTIHVHVVVISIIILLSRNEVSALNTSEQ